MGHRIAVIGGGASGVLTAVHLLTRAGAAQEVTIIEPAERLGRGLAYGTDDPRHLLNVRAAGMSAFPDQPDDFRVWAGAAPNDYVPRRRYAEYLQDALVRADSSRSGMLRHLRARALDVNSTADGYAVETSDGTIEVDAVVLATGHALPRMPPGIDVDPDVTPVTGSAPAEPGSTTLVLGSGLSAVDIALTVLGDHGDSRVVLISRHGLLPAAHDEPWIPASAGAPLSASEMIEGLPMWTAMKRITDAGATWRQSVDSLRASAQQIWHAMSHHQREQFLRHAERYWEVHRHRMPRQVARALEEWMREGRLCVVAAHVGAARTWDGGVELLTSEGVTITGHRLAIATGPRSALQGNELVSRLVVREFLRADNLGIGIDVDPATLRALDGTGVPHAAVYVIGPPTKGVLWESTAIPEIRQSASLIAQEIAT